jgi:hypothetical protein
LDHSFWFEKRPLHPSSDCNLEAGFSACSTPSKCSSPPKQHGSCLCSLLICRRVVVHPQGSYEQAIVYPRYYPSSALPWPRILSKRGVPVVMVNSVEGPNDSGEKVFTLPAEALESQSVQQLRPHPIYHLSCAMRRHNRVSSFENHSRSSNMAKNQCKQILQEFRDFILHLQNVSLAQLHNTLGVDALSGWGQAACLHTSISSNESC